MTKASDNDYPSILLTEQGSAPTTPAASHQRLYIRTSDHTLVTVNSSGTVVPVAAAITYTAYTPALSVVSGTPPTLGSGSSARGRYAVSGKVVNVAGNITFGSSGVAAGTGTYTISLPTAQRTPVSGDQNMPGSGWIYDSSAGLFRAVILFYQTDTTATIFVVDGSAFVSNAAPWTWAASDQINFVMTYEAA